MRLFSEYIAESRQNYIFGGTDNRNTDLPTSFMDLKKGDVFYVWSTWDKHTYYAKSLIENPYKDNKMIILQTEHGLNFVYLKDAYKSYACSDKKDKRSWVVAVTPEELIAAVKENFDITLELK